MIIPQELAKKYGLCKKNAHVLLEDKGEWIQLKKVRV
jgi:hypothetical protein